MFEQPDILDWLAYALGALGSLVLAVAYYRLERGTYKTSMGRYYLINMSGSGVLVVSLLIHFNLGAFIIEFIWAAISFRGYINDRRARQS